VYLQQGNLRDLSQKSGFEKWMSMSLERKMGAEGRVWWRLLRIRGGEALGEFDDERREWRTAERKEGGESSKDEEFFCSMKMNLD
jgi:hypothetical protein